MRRKQNLKEVGYIARVDIGDVGSGACQAHLRMVQAGNWTADILINTTGSDASSS